VWTLDPVLFTFGTPVTLDVRGDATAGVRAVKNGSGRAFGHFGNTIAWSRILEVTDAAGNPISEFPLASQSGFDYAALVIPEPSAGGLLGVGLALLRGRRRS
jgi:hypothetical protein